MDTISNEIKDYMIQNAMDTAFKIYNSRQIFPCNKFKTLDECFTIDNNNIMFWYNINTGYGMTTRVTLYPIS